MCKIITTLSYLVNHLYSISQAEQAVITTVRTFPLFLLLTVAPVYFHWNIQILQTLNTCGLVNSNGPHFYVTSIEGFNILILGQEKKEVPQTIPNDSTPQILWPCCALSCSDMGRLGVGCLKKHDRHFRAQREKNDNASWTCFGHRLTRMLRWDILLNPTQPPSATNSDPYATGWENEVRLSKRQAQAQAGQKGQTCVEQTPSKFTAVLSEMFRRGRSPVQVSLGSHVSLHLGCFSLPL